MPVKPKAKTAAKPAAKKATVSNKKVPATAPKKGAKVEVEVELSPGSKSEKDWMAEDDFRTLARAREIEADRARLARAKAAAKEQAAKAAKLAATIGAKS